MWTYEESSQKNIVFTTVFPKLSRRTSDDLLNSNSFQVGFSFIFSPSTVNLNDYLETRQLIVKLGTQLTDSWRIVRSEQLSPKIALHWACKGEKMDLNGRSVNEHRGHVNERHWSISWSLWGIWYLIKKKKRGVSVPGVRPQNASKHATSMDCQNPQ